MADFTIVEDFPMNMAHGVFDLDETGNTLVLALSATAPGSETSDPTQDGNGILGNVTEIAYTGLSSRNLTRGTNTQSNGLYSVLVVDTTLDSTSDSVPAFRYIYVYAQEPTSPADPLLGYFDYGSSLELNNGESLEIDFTGALLTVGIGT